MNESLLESCEFGTRFDTSQDGFKINRGDILKFNAY
jgi:hypothetical protein